MTAEHRSGRVPGELLSCYTASVAEYLRQCGADAELAIGSQLFLALRLDRRVPGLLGFLHHHTPLRGSTPTHQLHLARCWSPEPAVASRRIAAEVERAGRVVVVGDTFNLPWQLAHQKAHAPHWFLVDGIDRSRGRMHITDLFQFIDETGEQGSFQGWLGLDRLDALAAVNPDQRPEFRLRDQFALGDQENPDQIATHGSQWFEASHPAGGTALTEEQRLALLERTCGYARDELRRVDLDAREWCTGLAALDRLAKHYSDNLENPTAYDNSDDLWVAARNRQLFARVLARLGRELAVPELGELADWCEREVVKHWASVPRILRYNQGLLRRGRAPRPLLVVLLREAAAAERALIGRLMDVLARTRGRASDARADP